MVDAPPSMKTIHPPLQHRVSARKDQTYPESASQVTFKHWEKELWYPHQSLQMKHYHDYNTHQVNPV